MANTAELVGDVLHVTETFVGRRKNTSKHWYYNLRLKTRSMKGMYGEEPTVPLEPLQLGWLEKYGITLLVGEERLKALALLAGL